VPKKPETVEDFQLVAAVDLIGRTGATEFNLRFSPEDEPPVTWTALAQWGDTWECAAAMNPLLAVFRLCEQVVDGGQCTHCKRPAAFDTDFGKMPLDKLFCWYQWDPEKKTFRRGCE